MCGPNLSFIVDFAHFLDTVLMFWVLGEINYGFVWSFVEAVHCRIYIMVTFYYKLYICKTV